MIKKHECLPFQLADLSKLLINKSHFNQIVVNTAQSLSWFISSAKVLNISTIVLTATIEMFVILVILQLDFWEILYK